MASGPQQPKRSQCFCERALIKPARNAKIHVPFDLAAFVRGEIAALVTTVALLAA